MSTCRPLLTLAAVALTALTAGPVAARPPLVKVQAWEVGTYTSNTGETKDAFVLRVAAVLDEWSRTEHTEACGPIAQYPDGRYVVALTTEKAQTMCIQSTAPPAGAVLTGDTIHNHPEPTSRSGMVRLGADDAVALRAAKDDMWRCARRRSGCWVNVKPYEFSGADYNGGAGYLVVAGRLLYQHGWRTSAVVDPDIQATLAATKATHNAPAIAEVGH